MACRGPRDTPKLTRCGRCPQGTGNPARSDQIQIALTLERMRLRNGMQPSNQCLGCLHCLTLLSVLSTVCRVPSLMGRPCSTRVLNKNYCGKGLESCQSMSEDQGVLMSEGVGERFPEVADGIDTRRGDGQESSMAPGSLRW